MSGRGTWVWSGLQLLIDHSETFASEPVLMARGDEFTPIAEHKALIVTSCNNHDALVAFVRSVANDRDDCVSPGLKAKARALLAALKARAAGGGMG